MKHAGQAALDTIEPLLERIRAAGGLKEKSRGVFYLRSKSFLHFHEDPKGMFADIRAGATKDFDRLKVEGAASEDELLARIRASTGQ